MSGAHFDAVEVRRPNLRIAFPPQFITRLVGQTVVTLDRRAKYLVAALSSGETLVMHLGMSGSFHVEVEGDTAPAASQRAADKDTRHDHVVFRMSSGAVVTFNDPRRFGFMDLVPAGLLASHPVLTALGPEPLSPAFNAAALALACKGKRIPLKVALLDQHVVAGLGNIYASEALHLAGLSPARRASTIATPSGLPRPTAHRLAVAIKKVLIKAIARKSTAAYRTSSGTRFRVYDREGEGCPTVGCDGTIKRRTQAGRSTFYCATCQR